MSVSPTGPRSDLLLLTLVSLFTSTQCGWRAARDKARVYEYEFSPGQRRESEVAGEPALAGGDEARRIIGGQPATRNEAPFFVSVQQTSLLSSTTAKNAHFCGGSLIGSRHVLTAAHCCVPFVDADVGMTVRGGTTNLLSREGVAAQVLRAFVHPNYVDFAAILFNDLCVLELVAPLAGVPTAGFSSGLGSTPGTPVTAVGFGSTTDVNGDTVATLQKVGLQTVSSAQGSRFIRQTHHSSWVYAGERGRDTCVGDSGGPLFAVGGEIVGVTSWGLSCGIGPGVYADTASEATWIRAAIAGAPNPLPPSACVSGCQALAGRNQVGLCVDSACVVLNGPFAPIGSPTPNPPAALLPVGPVAPSSATSLVSDTSAPALRAPSPTGNDSLVPVLAGLGALVGLAVLAFVALLAIGAVGYFLSSEGGGSRGVGWRDIRVDPQYSLDGYHGDMGPLDEPPDLDYDDHGHGQPQSRVPPGDSLREGLEGAVGAPFVVIPVPVEPSVYYAPPLPMREYGLQPGPYPWGA